MVLPVVAKVLLAVLVVMVSQRVAMVLLGGCHLLGDGFGGC